MPTLWPKQVLPFRPICVSHLQACLPDLRGAVTAVAGKEGRRMTYERLRELALNIASANGVMRVDMYRGKPYETAQIDYQAAVCEFDMALAEVFAELRVTKTLYEESCNAAYDRGADIGRIAQLEAALKRYGSHDFWGCDELKLQTDGTGKVIDDRLPCSCGFAAFQVTSVK
jgi:hypothetical protein